MKSKKPSTSGVPKLSREAKHALETAQKQELVLNLLHKNAGNVTQACNAANISRMTYYRWCDDSDLFNEKVIEVRESLVDYAEAALLSMIKAKNVTATIYFLKTQGKHRGYGE